MQSGLLSEDLKQGIDGSYEHLTRDENNENWRNWYMGCSKILTIPLSPIFNFTVLATFVIAYYSVLVEFAAVASRSSNLHISIKSDGIVNGFVFCSDFMLFIDISLATLRRKSNLSSRHPAVIFMEFIAFIPFEIIYVVLLGPNRMLFCGLRLRYVLRLFRFNATFNLFLAVKYSIVSVVLKFVTITGLICITLLCIRIVYICNYDPDPNLDCTKITPFDYTVIYFTINGQITNTDILLEGLSYVNIKYYYGIFQMIIFIYVYVISAELICIYIEVLLRKYDFAIKSHVALYFLNMVKRKRGIRWSLDDDAFLNHLKNYVNMLWKCKLNQHIQNIELGGYAIVTIPKIFKIELNMDLSWNLFKHSILFKGEETHVLRYLSNFTEFQRFLSGDIISKKGKYKNRMVYILSGIVDILSEDNQESPIVSLTGGSCIGEFTLFMSYPSSTTVVCKTYCDLLLLSRRNFIQMKGMYPKRYDVLRNKALDRIRVARNYDRIGKSYSDTGIIESNKSDLSLKYIRISLRAYIGDHKADDIDDIYALDEAKTEFRFKLTVFCTDYLTMYVLAKKLSKTLKVNVMRSGFFFKLNPHSTILEIWNCIIYTLALTTCIIFPIAATLEEEEYIRIYHFYMTFISIMYILDFASFIFIAVESMDIMLIKFEDVLNKKMENSYFWIDLFSSLPIAGIIYLLNGPLPRNSYEFWQFNKILKVHKVLTYFQKKQFSSPKSLLAMTLIKVCLSFFVVGLIGYFIFNLFNYYQGYEMSDISQYRIFIVKVGLVFQFYLSTTMNTFKITKDFNLVPLIILQYMIFIWKFRIIPKLMASFSLYSKQSTQYENIVEDVRRLLVMYSLDNELKKSMDNYMRINYKMDRGLYMNKLNLLKSFIGNSLYSIQNNIISKEYFLMDPFFKDLPNKILKQVNEISKYILVPKGSIVCYAGCFPDQMYVIVKGICAYVDGSRTTKFLNIGSAFLVIEALRRVPIVHNVLAVTDCKLIAIPTDRFLRKFLKYPNHYAMLQSSLMDTVRYDVLKELERTEAKIEIKTTNTEFGSFNKFYSKRFVELITGYGNKSAMRIFLMKLTITPYGKFWLYWEIFRNIVAFVNAFIGTIPITTHDNRNSIWFILFRIFDFIGLVDIYLKHHLVYYNKKYIEVSHPWKTSCYYWKNSFVIDFLGFLPIDWFCMLIDGFTKKQIIILVLPRLNRYLPLYRSIGLRKYLIESYLTELRILLIAYYALNLMLLCNLFMALYIFNECTIDFVKSELICGENVNPFWEHYFIYSTMVMKNAFAIGLYDGKYLDTYVWKVCIVSTFGYMLIIYISCSFTGLSLFKLSYLTTYQIKMQRLVYFMGMCKIDKRLWEEMIKYYEYIWILREGKRFRLTFQHFNNTLCDELLYSKYGKTLSKTILFKGCPDVVITELLHNQSVKFSVFLIRGIVLKINDIQNNIFILYQGLVDVLDPGYDCINELTVGSIFGCLDDVNMHRVTLTYVAKTHCEFIVLPVKDFYNVLKRHPSVYHHYKYLMSNTNMDFIKSKSVIVMDNITEISHLQNITITMRVKSIFKVHEPTDNFVKVFVILSFISFKLEALQKVLLLDYTSFICVLYLFDILYWIKIYMCFSTAYENNYGLLVRRRKLIALRYIQNIDEFAIDIISNFPLEIISLMFIEQKICGTLWSYLRLNRLLKIVCVFKYVRSIRNRLHINVFFVRGIYILLIVVTMQQLAMIVIVQNPMIQNQGNLFYMYVMPFSIQQYLMSTATFVPFGLGDNPVRKEICYNVILQILMMVSQLMIIYVFSECASTYQVLKYGDLRYESYLQLLSSDMESKGISKPLKERTIKYFRNLVKSGRHVQMPQFIREAPFYLKQGVLDSMFGFHLRMHPVFRNCHLDLLRQMAATFETLYFFKDDYITFVGDLDGKMYFIHEGEVVGLSEDNLLFETAEVRLTVGHYFGMYQLISTSIGHKYTYRVVTDSTILMLRKESVAPLISMFPASKHLIYSTLNYRNIHNATKTNYMMQMVESEIF